MSTIRQEMKWIADSFVMPWELGNIFLAHRPLFKFFSCRGTNYSQWEWKDSKILACSWGEEECERKRKAFKLLLRQRPCLLKTISLQCTKGLQQALKTLSFLKGNNLQFTGNRNLSDWRGRHKAVLLALSFSSFLVLVDSVAPHNGCQKTSSWP